MGTLPFTPQQTRALVDAFGVPAYREIDLDADSLARTTGTLLNDFTRVYHGTPYGSITVMLDALARESLPGEEVHLIVLTDGEFGGVPGTQGAVAMTSAMQQFNTQIPGDVTVSYVQILPDPSNDSDRNKELRENVDAQGIRDGMLTAFNGSASEGSYEVESGEALWAALQDIISDIAATDREDQGRYIQYSGDTISIDAPFSISRIIAVSTQANGPPLRVDPNSFPQTRPIEINTRMPAPDAFYPGLLFQGVTSQFLFDPMLPAGQHQVTFQGPVSDDVFLLFDTEVSMQNRIVLAETGEEAPRQQNGTYELSEGTDYLVVATLFDPQSNAQIDFDVLASDAEFSGVFEIGGAEFDLDYRRNDNEDRAEATLRPTELGAAEIRGESVIPGFVSPRAEPLQIEVISRSVGLTLISVDRAEDCASCAPNEYQTTVLAGDPDKSVASINVQADAGQNGEMTVGLGPMAGILNLVGPNGQVISDGDVISLPTGISNWTFVVRRAGQLDVSDMNAQEGFGFDLTLTPSGQSVGDPVQASGGVILKVTEVDLVLTGYDQGSPSGGPMKLTGQDLVNGDFGAAFELRNYVVPEPKIDDFSLDLRGPPLTLIGMNGSRFTEPNLDLTPKTGFWCLCWIANYSAIMGPTRTIDVVYRDAAGIQTDRERLVLNIEVAGRTWSLSCLLNFLFLLIFIWLFGALIATLRTVRFPKQSMAVQPSSEDSYGRQEPLRGTNLTFVKALLWPILGVPHERTTVKGLRLRATPDGAQILLDRRTSTVWEVEQRAATIKELCEIDPDLQAVVWSGEGDLNP